MYNIKKIMILINHFLKNSYVCMYGKGETNVFGEEITFCVKYDKFSTWKWKCTARHISSNTESKVDLCQTQKIAVQYALRSLIQKLTKTGKLNKSKGFTKGIMSELNKNGWTMAKIMQTVQKQMQMNKDKKKKRKRSQVSKL